MRSASAVEIEALGMIQGGLADLVVKPRMYERLRDILRGQSLLIFAGIVQRSDDTAGVLVHEAWPLPVDIG